MDTSSSALSRIICLLGEHQGVQDKLRQEILEAKRSNNGEELDYDQLVALPFLDAVCRETLRLYVSFRWRLKYLLTSKFRHPPLSIAIRMSDIDSISELDTMTLTSPLLSLAPEKTWYYHCQYPSRLPGVKKYLRFSSHMEQQFLRQYTAQMLILKYGARIHTSGNQSGGLSRCPTPSQLLICPVYIHICTFSILPQLSTSANTYRMTFLGGSRACM
jgi:hypothetical protein